MSEININRFAVGPASSGAISSKGSSQQTQDDVDEVKYIFFWMAFYIFKCGATLQSPSNECLRAFLKFFKGISGSKAVSYNTLFQN